jgi:GalNAc-alpha-(1->4)-GalNAc-alpha-(1->3)-diNAcBac-PP-undecaprenol alpha-1,4-N-acetyl-D-galactosaminyltransferase
MRILLLISSLGPGGAERVMTLLADALAGRGHDVCLLTLAGSDSDFFSVGSGVRRIALALTGDSRTVFAAVSNNLRRLKAIRRTVCEYAPGVIVSFMTHTNILAIAACAFLPVRVVVSERVDPRGHRLERLWSILRLISYRRADALVVQTQEAATWFRRRMRGRLAVTAIANPRPPGAAAASAGDPIAMQISPPFILAAGRLVHQKGFDLLIKAFALVLERCPNMQLAIAGEGPEQRALIDLATSLGIEKKVLLLGRVAALPDLMRQAHAFVLSSRYEGFPNVLLEALVNGIPVVSTDCPSGPREILLDGKYGLLALPESSDSLADALLRVVTDEELRKRLSGIGPEAVRRYDIDNVVVAWEQVMASEQALLSPDGASR